MNTAVSCKFIPYLSSCNRALSGCVVGCQVPTKAALSLLLLSWTRERKYNEKLVGRVKDRDITYQLPSWAKQTELGEKINLLPIKPE